MSECYKEVFRKARKKHKCDICGRLIQKGEKYSDSSYLVPGEGWGSWQVCTQCKAIEDYVMRDACNDAFYEDGYNSDDVKEEIMFQICEDCGALDGCHCYEKMLTCPNVIKKATEANENED